MYSNYECQGVFETWKGWAGNDAETYWIRWSRNRFRPDPRHDWWEQIYCGDILYERGHGERRSSSSEPDKPKHDKPKTVSFPPPGLEAECEYCESQ